MNKLDELDFEEEAPSEITLGVSSLLGIFFAAVLVCGVFFGFGYTVGRSSMQKVIAAANNGAASSDAGFNSFKPSPVSPAIQNVPSDASTANTGASATGTDTLNPATTEPTLQTQTPAYPAPVNTATSPRTVAPATTASAAPTQTSTLLRTTAAAAPAALTHISSSTPAAVVQNVPTMVQIAAVSHQEDANVLLSALRKRGYNVMAKPDLTDNLIHVQVGPFANRAEANAMRQKLLADGYNAIIK
ncbi:MAG: SPOR domain-containing protein [Acidobacteriaceae bacterium]